MAAPKTQSAARGKSVLPKKEKKGNNTSAKTPKTVIKKEPL